MKNAFEMMKEELAGQSEWASFLKDAAGPPPEVMVDILNAATWAVQDTVQDDWTGYKIHNERMQLHRLRLWLPCGLEFQINKIWHAVAPHFHRAPMASRILQAGYWWQLRQLGAVKFVKLFAAPGSVVTMGPDDVHLIDRVDKGRLPSISVCLFADQYPGMADTVPLSPGEHEALWSQGVQLCAEKGKPWN